MSEAKINVSTGFNGGVSVSLRADNAVELLALQNELRQAAASDQALASIVAVLVGGTPAHEAQAVATVQAAFPQAAPVSTVGQPLPQVAAPAPWNAPVAQPGGAIPPGLVDPGPCAHGPRQYKNTNTTRGAWSRWECSVPYSSETKATRCKAINA
jgi:hypothetical protein